MRFIELPIALTEEARTSLGMPSNSEEWRTLKVEVTLVEKTICGLKSWLLGINYIH